MTREEARRAAEVMLAYAEGKQIDWSEKRADYWIKVVHPTFNWERNDYRIKPEFEYRHFKDSDEAFKEMKKHEPFGWIKEKNSNFKMCVLSIDNDGILVGDYEDDKVFLSYETIFKHHAFADGSPIGIKEV